MSAEGSQNKIPYPFTAVPNSYLDYWMRRLGNQPNAKLAMIYIFRRTVGWDGRPIEATITLEEFREAIGIASDTTIEAALHHLQHQGYIEILQRGGSKSARVYRLTVKSFQSTEIVDLSSKTVETPRNLSVFLTDASTDSKDTNLQKSKIVTYRDRRSPSPETEESSAPPIPRQSTPEVVPQDSKHGAKEKEKKEGKENRKERVPPSAGADAPVCNQEEEQEEQTDLVTLRTEYAALSQQLEQLDAKKQAGQWARPYKQVQAAEARLRQAEQDAPPSLPEPAEYAKQQQDQANEGGTVVTRAEVLQADERQEQLRTIASDLLSWKGGLKVLRQAQLPKWRGYFKWQIEAKIEALQAAYARLRAEPTRPDG